MSQFYHTPAPDSRVYRIRTLRRNMKPIFVHFRGCSKGCSSSNRIKSIVLSNEKYKGDALLQKVYTTDFLTKKKKKNEGEVPQYYVEGNHEAIIPPAQFDRVQKERLDKVSGRIMERQAKREMIEAFLHDIVIFDMPTAQELEKLAVDIRNNREKYGLSA